MALLRLFLAAVFALTSADRGRSQALDWAIMISKLGDHNAVHSPLAASDRRVDRICGPVPNAWNAGGLG